MLNVIMLYVTKKPFMLSVIRLNVIMLNAIMLSVIMLNVVAHGTPNSPPIKIGPMMSIIFGPI
jgi:hypothetical protein